MCGRFAIRQSNETLAEVFQAEPTNTLSNLPNYNVCPTDTVPVVASIAHTRRLGAMRWGFVPQWYRNPTDGPLIINARAETIAQKPSFAEAVRRRRCIVPMTGYFEWRIDGEQRIPYFTHNADGTILAVAGIWQHWRNGHQSLVTCAIVTVESNATMRHLHHRMPLILSKKDWGKWLGEEGHGAASLMRSSADGVQNFYEVDTKVNSNRASGEDLIEPKPKGLFDSFQ